MKDLKATIKEYEGWIILAVVVYLIYCFRGVFTTLGDTAGAAAEAALAKAKADAQNSADKNKVKASTGSTRQPSDAEIATWKADANTLAHMLGHDSLSFATVFKDRAAAFALLKSRYSRLLFKNNKPYYVQLDAKGKKTYPATTDETPHSVKRSVNWKVLAPFYKEACGGTRDLLADLRSDLDIPEYRPYIKWVI